MKPMMIFSSSSVGASVLPVLAHLVLRVMERGYIQKVVNTIDHLNPHPKNKMLGRAWAMGQN